MCMREDTVGLLLLELVSGSEDLVVWKVKKGPGIVYEKLTL